MGDGEGFLFAAAARPTLFMPIVFQSLRAARSIAVMVKFPWSQTWHRVSHVHSLRVE